MKLLNLRWSKKQRVWKELHTKIPSGYWWGIFTLICMMSVVIKLQLCVDFVYCGNIEGLSFWINVGSTIFLLSGFFKTIRVWRDK